MVIWDQVSGYDYSKVFSLSAGLNTDYPTLYSYRGWFLFFVNLIEQHYLVLNSIL